MRFLYVKIFCNENLKDQETIGRLVLEIFSVKIGKYISKNVHIQKYRHDHTIWLNHSNAYFSFKKYNKTARKDHKSISQSGCCKILKEKLELEKKIFERIKYKIVKANALK